LLSSFSAEALQAAQAAAPELPRAWLLDAASPLDWLCAHDLGCVAVVLHHSRCSASVIAQAHHLGLRALAYTVNDARRAEQLQEWGVDGIITDAKFKTYGCGSAIASSSLVTEWVKGRTLDEASTIRNTDIAQELALPPVKIHCSILAEDAIKSAIEDYKKKHADIN
jgi:hypothetical protein